MPRKVEFVLLFLFFISISYSQDVIIKRDSTKVYGKIIKDDSLTIYYSTFKYGHEMNLSIKKSDILSYYKEAPKPNEGNKEPEKTEFDHVAIGIGAGMDYGGLIGVNLNVYVHKNVGLFAGGGYALIGLGYNVGLKLRWIPSDRYFEVFNPFVSVMYGYNAVVRVTNADRYNKMFFGPTIGVGIDDRKSSGCWSYALLIPIRGPEVNAYIQDLQTNHRVVFKVGLLPVGISIGYKFTLW